MRLKSWTTTKITKISIKQENLTIIPNQKSRKKSLHKLNEVDGNKGEGNLPQLSLPRDKTLTS